MTYERQVSELDPYNTTCPVQQQYLGLWWPLPEYREEGMKRNREKSGGQIRSDEGRNQDKPGLISDIEVRNDYISQPQCQQH